MRLKSMVFCMAILLIGCSPKIDGSDDEAFEESLDEITESLPEEEREAFKEAAGYLMISGVGDALFDTEMDDDDVARDMRERLDGMTAQEVISQAEVAKAEAEEREAKRRAERKEREREQAQQELGELKELRQKSKDIREELAMFDVERSRFRMESREFSGDQPIIELTVHNGTNHAISRAYFKGVLSTPGRSVPWLEETFNYSIRGGLEPGESAEWELSPNRYSEWGRVEEIDDMVFTVEVTRLDGPDGDAILQDNFTERDERRLETLRKKF